MLPLRELRSQPCMQLCQHHHAEVDHAERATLAGGAVHPDVNATLPASACGSVGYAARATHEGESVHQAMHATTRAPACGGRPCGPHPPRAGWHTAPSHAPSPPAAAAKAHRQEDKYEACTWVGGRPTHPGPSAEAVISRGSASSLRQIFFKRH